MKRLAPAPVVLGLLLALSVSLLAVAGAERTTNGGFESGTSGWSWSDGALDTVPAPAHSGSAAGRFTSDAQPSTQSVYQISDVVPGASYEFSGWVLLNDPNVTRVGLRIHWLTSAAPIGPVSSVSDLTSAVPGFRHLTTGMVTAPLAAQSARVSVQVVATGDFEVYLDDLSFDGPSPTVTPLLTSTLTPAPTQTSASTPSSPPHSPTPQPATTTPNGPSTPTPTPSATPAKPTSPPEASGPQLTPTPTQTPPSVAIPTASPMPQAPLTATPTLAASATPTPTPTPHPTGTPVVEPLVFEQLTNGGFEETRADGTSYAWHKFGGWYGSTLSRSFEGDRSLKFTSSTESTKWVYQTVEITGGASYEASVHGLKDHAGIQDLFLRVSFYASNDGSGQAISSTDSLDMLTDDDPGFRFLTTGTVQTPPEASTAKVRLMLRPASDAVGTAYFDAASFERVSPTSESPQPSQELEDRTATPEPAPETAVGSPPSPGQPEAHAPATALSPTLLEFASTPRSLANVGPSPAIGAPSQADLNGGGYDWLVALAIALPSVGLVAVGIAELRRGRENQNDS